MLRSRFYVDFVNKTTSWTRPSAVHVSPRDSLSGSWAQTGMADLRSSFSFHEPSGGSPAPAPAAMQMMEVTVPVGVSAGQAFQARA